MTVEWFAAPDRPGPDAGPAALMLHGADGLRFGDRYRAGARALAASGVGVALVH